MELELETTNQQLQGQSALDILNWCYETFDQETIKLSTSFGAEGLVLLHMLVSLVKKPRVFTIDTGRNFQETYDVWQQVRDRYQLNIEAHAPDPLELARLLENSGPNLFYASVENRKNCCYVRKVQPLAKALQDCTVWITGLRRGQHESRTQVPIISYNSQHQVYKLCPLAAWQETHVWEYVRNNNLPYNRLHDQGYPTIGCLPCSRPVRPAEDMRSGRWWWEKTEHKECGIHLEQDKAVRKQQAQNWEI